MKKLMCKTFMYNHELCDFVNTHNVLNNITIQQIVLTDKKYVLFYWEENNE